MILLAWELGSGLGHLVSLREFKGRESLLDNNVKKAESRFILSSLPPINTFLSAPISVDQRSLFFVPLRAFSWPSYSGEKFAPRLGIKIMSRGFFPNHEPHGARRGFFSFRTCLKEPDASALRLMLNCAAKING